MIVGIGIDLVEIELILKKNNPHFYKRILSDEELMVYKQITNRLYQAQYVASRFAAKEALFKAFRFGDQSFNYRDIAVLNDEYHAPYFHLKKTVIHDYEKIHLSITHSERFAMAYVVIWKNQ